MTQTLQPMTEEMMRSVAMPPDDEAGFGALTTERGVLPLQALDVQVRIDGLLAEMQLMQTFVNTHSEPLEATYIFPLPDRAAVTRFRLEVAGRIVEGELKERGAARQEYERAIEEGHRAAITEEERPGVFTMRVGNLPPGETAKVMLTLTGPLPYSEGEATFRFPLVVAPRYIPGTPLPGDSVGVGTVPDTDAVPDASRITPPVLLPGYPNPMRLSMAVEFAPSPLTPTDIRSSLHALLEERTEQGKRLVAQPGERLNRDFIVRFRVGTDKIVTALSLQPDESGSEGTFTLTLVPPASGPNAVKKPRDVVFVLDRSGSMGGWKMIAARRALARMVDTLTDQDRFTVYAFDDVIETPPSFHGNQLVAATNRQRYQAVEFLAKLEARNGTEMAQPLTQGVGALNALATERQQQKERERILVLVTDGQVGNEDQILRDLGKQLKHIRVFTLGIDQAVNAAFLQRLADLGGGTSQLVESEERLDEVMDQVHRHISTPVLTSLKLEPAGLSFVPGSIVPARLPDLFAGTPLLLMGRYSGTAQGALALQARDASGKEWNCDIPAQRTTNTAPASVWARGRLRTLEDRYVLDSTTELEKEIVATSLRFGVLCRFTAFVAVDRASVVNPGGQVHSIVQAVEQPAGWAMANGGHMLACASAMPMGAMAFEMCEDAAEDSLRMMAAPPPSPPQDRAKARSFKGAIREMVQEKQAAAEEASLISVEELLQALTATPPDAPARLLALKMNAPAFEALVQAATAEGRDEQFLQRLNDCWEAWQYLLTSASPDDADVSAVWEEILALLQEYPAPAPRSKRFWA